MARLLLFNPENDLALAADERNYTPRAQAAALHRAGRLLPAWWCERGDLIVADESDAGFLEEIKRQFGLHGEIATPAKIADCVTEVEPWGWSLDAKRQFELAGVPSKLLPDDDTLSRWRRLSNRASAVWLNQFVADHLFDTSLPWAPVAVDSVDDAMAILERNRLDCYVKAPWSSSGRGVFASRSMPLPTLTRQVSGIIRRQGSVVIEPALDRVDDFAALYYCQDGVPQFMGWSIFKTFDRCAYSGNLVADNACLSEMVRKIVAPLTIEAVIDLHLAGLGQLLAGSGYTGWLGVDMLTYRDNHRLTRLDACVEINLRRTMGVLAMDIARRSRDLSCRNMFSISYKGDVVAGVDIVLPSEGFRFTIA